MHNAENLVDVTVLRVSGEQLACLNLDASANADTVRKALAEYIAPGDAISGLLTECGEQLLDSQTIGALSMNQVLLQAVVNPVPLVFERCQPSAEITDDARTVDFVSTSGGAITNTCIRPNSGIYVLRLRFEECGPPYVSVGLVARDNSLSCGPGYDSYELAWHCRDGISDLRADGEWAGAEAVGDPPLLSSGAELCLSYDSDCGLLTCSDLTANASFSVRNIPHVDRELSWGVGGCGGTTASLLD